LVCAPGTLSGTNARAIENRKMDIFMGDVVGEVLMELVVVDG
jgi:hypothetical protein